MKFTERLVFAIAGAIILGLFIGAVLSKRAKAEEAMRPPADLTMVLPPPWRFDHPYRGKVTEYRMFVDAARMLCKKQGAEADSCSWVDRTGRCFIVVPWDAPVKDLSQYQRHEIAHCNGWGANHEK